MLICGGFDFVCSYESCEDWLVVDIDLLFLSVVEDVVEFGDDVCFIGGCGVQVCVKLDVLLCCFINLVDNVVKYGGGVEFVLCGDGGVSYFDIIVIDCGFGIFEDQVVCMFELFVCGIVFDGCVIGIGIGFIIVKVQVEIFGGWLIFVNWDQSGLQVIVCILINLF